MSGDGLFLGGVIDADGDRTDTGVRFDPADLTTHAVIVGMTGSGKTGLGIVCLEEVLTGGVPALIIDPKGDMTNLLLGFPALTPADFEPWVDPAEARKAGVSTAELAGTKATQWSEGLASWNLGGTDIETLHTTAGFTVYTPGSSAGIPLDIVGSLANPGLDWDAEAETLREQIQGFASGLLGMIGVDADPMSSREHILICNLVEHAWRNGADLDLATLLAQVQRPPLRKLGVFEVDAFFPEKDRTALAMKLNGLLASPAFAEWVSGAPLDIPGMLWDGEGRPQAAIVYVAHLSDEECQFVVTLLLSKLVTWMRSQPGTTDLRALVYMDEVFGFVPPTAEPPAKRPILTLLKQARAYGVGVMLATQNPVDLDYKAMSNAATWFVGRLQTERDKARIVEALRSVDGAGDVASLDRAISALGKRQFLLQSAHLPDPVLFTTRWALSYLAGPLTRQQITRLRAEAPSATATPETATGPGHPVSASFPSQTTVEADPAVDGVPPATPADEPPMPDPGRDLAADETPVMPKVAEGIPVRYLDAGAPWAAAIGATSTTAGGPVSWGATVAVRCQLTFDDRTAGLDHTEEWETVIPLDAGFDPNAAITVDYDDRDLVEDEPPGIRYRIPDSKVATAAFWREARTQLADHLTRERTLTLLENAELRLFSRPGETAADFAERCDAMARERADEETAKLSSRYATKLAAARKRFEAADRRVTELESDVAGQRQNELAQGAGALISILTGKATTRSVTGSAQRRTATQRTETRLSSAQDKAMSEWEAMAALDAELAAELEEINDRWEARGAAIGQAEIPLERTDVRIDQLVLLWIPGI